MSDEENPDAGEEAVKGDEPEEEETATDPEETATDPEETAIDPEETATDTEETAIDPEETATDLDETATHPEELAIDTEETAIDPEETAIDPEETAIDLEETAIDPEETAIDPEETATDSEETATIPEVTADDLKARIETLQIEYRSQQVHMDRMQAEVFKLKRQLSHQSSFCASLGAVLGQLLWKSSQLEMVVDKMMSGSKLGDFFCIVEGTLASFLDTYRGSMPSAESDERQFLMAMCGVVTNVAASPQGREYLCGNPNGMTLLRGILRAIPGVSSRSGRDLKRLLVMVLYNVSINRTGQKMMQSPCALSVIGSCISCPLLTLLTLKVLQSITYSIADTDTLQGMIQSIPIADIQELTTADDAEIREHATAVLNNIRSAADEFHATNQSKSCPRKS